MAGHNRDGWVSGWTLLTAGLAVGTALMLRPRQQDDLRGEVVLITGGTRGLGLLLAEGFGREGCKVAICGRDADSLARARDELAARGIDALGLVCDVGDEAQVRTMIDAVTAHYGRIDILVNNAATAPIGPVYTLDVDDFRRAQDVLFWGGVYTTLAVLPAMRARRSGRIVNVTSIGGKVSVPHMAAYSAAKYAATGFSEGLRAELLQDGVVVTTIAPGLIRTGAFLHGEYSGQQAKEFTWFALTDSLPFLSMSAARAARQIIAAVKERRAIKILTTQATLLARLHGLFPGLVTDLFGLANTIILPKARPDQRATEIGLDVEPRVPGLVKLLAVLGLRAAEQLHQYPRPIEETRAVTPVERVPE